MPWESYLTGLGEPIQTGESFLLKFEVGLDWLKQDGLSNPSQARHQALDLSKLISKRLNAYPIWKNDLGLDQGNPKKLDKEVVEIGRITSTDQHEAKFQTSREPPLSESDRGDFPLEVGLGWLCKMTSWKKCRGQPTQCETKDDKTKNISFSRGPHTPGAVHCAFHPFSKKSMAS